jgi:mitochondrial enoyl-[acyl-carrier protein] reductase / trans-2-enoyl-CoA reductase
MLRAQYDQHGPVPEDLIYPVQFELPPLEAGQALVEVIAAPINPADLLVIKGEHGELPPLPAIGGREGVGRLAELAANTEGLGVGQLVLLPFGCGSWSTHVVVEAAQLVSIPVEADPQQLAMMTINPPTASLLLSEFVQLEPGEWLIQSAGNSAVGLYVAQLARRRGWRTVSVVRRPEVVEAVSEAGGDVVLVDGEDLHARVAEATEGATIRVGFDSIGGSASGRLAECLGEGATLVSYGRMSGEPCVVWADAFVFRDLTMRGFWLVNWFRQTSRQERAALYGEIARLIAEGTLYAPIHAAYDISEIKAAVTAAEDGERSGKIVVEPRRQTL